MSKKIVLFGAGKIGRSFIGQLFSRGGYEVVFVDIFKPVIDALNERGSYKVIIKSAVDTEMVISNVRGVLASDAEQVSNEIASADLVAISVGIAGMSTAFPLIAQGLVKRFAIAPDAPLDIIIAENMRNADLYFTQELKALLPSTYPFESLVGLVETSIGKMVPIMLKKDMDEDVLQVFAEPYNTLIVAKNAFKAPIPVIEGLAPKANMKAWVDRKLFIHNLGHAATAYLGHLYNPNFVFLYEALAVDELYEKVRNTMIQASQILLKKYPDEFTPNDLLEHIDDLLMRFQNKALGDTIFRVGCDLQRKLSPEDRVVGAINVARELSLPYDTMLHVLSCAMRFRATNEQGQLFPGDVKFVAIYERGVLEVLTEVCGFGIQDAKEFAAKM